MMKLSRRNIYHTLKQKSEILQKVRYRPLHNSLKNHDFSDIEMPEERDFSATRLQTDKRKKFKKLTLHQLRNRHI
jgi:hypothetical protein